MLSFLTVSPAFERSQGGAAIASERELGMNEITTLLQQLVAIDSINPDVVEGNRLYGRGAYDMKGGLAAIMVAAAQAKKLSLRGDVILTAVAEERHDYEHVSEYPCFSGWLSFLLCRSVTRIFPL